MRTGRRNEIMATLSAAMLAWLGGCAAESDPWGRGAGALAEAEYTILLATATGGDHIEEINILKDLTARNTGWKNLITTHQEDHSVLYWGAYSRLEEAKQQLKVAKDFRSAQGRQPFPKAMIVPVPGGGVGPPEWDLTKAKGEYTVCVYVFHNDPELGWYDRKRAAVEFCRRLREERYEAYYYHGPSRSSVTIGTFGPEAVEMVKEGNTVKPVVVDAGIKAITENPRFRYMAVNCHEQIVTIPDPETRKPKKIKARSSVVRIPRAGKADVLD
jgi:hypothetical protein